MGGGHVWRKVQSLANVWRTPGVGSQTR